MSRKLTLIMGCMAMVFAVSTLCVAQEFPILWEDHFDDDDSLAHFNVGWFYYGESDGLVGQVVKQQDGELFVEAGNYVSVLGAGLVESNGVPALDSSDVEGTHSALVANNYSDPNQIVTFQVNFKRVSASYFMVGTRMVQTDTSETFPDADPTVSPAYALYISPLEQSVKIARYDAEMALLDPTSWTYFGDSTFTFEIDVYYWVRFYLKEGDLKVKIWEGDISDEPTIPWLIETSDPDPRVTGKFTMFAMLAPGAPPQPGQGDQFVIDDVVVRASSPTGVEEKEKYTIPARFQLAQNYPNPFNPSTQITFSLSEKNRTILNIYNTNGQLVRTLLNTELDAGSHTLSWDGRDQNYYPVPSGVYIYRLVSGEYSLSKRMVLLR